MVEKAMESGVKRALEANRAAYDALRESLRVGMSEIDAWQIVAKAVDAVCGEESHEFIGDCVGGVRSAGIEGPATEYRFAEGDALILDLSVRRGAVWSDTCRTFFFGGPSECQRKAYEMVLATQDHAFGLVRAGVIAESVKESVDSYLTANGYEGKMPHHVGHLIGEKPYMKPAFEFGDKSILAADQICTLEPGLYFTDDFGIRVENDYVIGNEGLENLFDYTREIGDFVI